MTRSGIGRHARPTTARGLVAVVALGLAAGCTTTGSTPEPTTAPVPSGSVPGSAPASNGGASPPATRSAGSPYYLAIPRKDKRELSRWTGRAGGGSTIISEDLKSGHRYRLEGACIYGYGDQLEYTVLDANADPPPNPVLATGSIACDGVAHSQTLIIKRTTPIQLQGGRMEDKSVAYLRVFP